MGRNGALRIEERRPRWPPLWVHSTNLLTGTFFWPPLWIARIVNDGQNVNQVIFDRVKNTIRKPWQKCAAHARNNFRVQKRDLLKAFELEFKS